MGLTFFKGKVHFGGKPGEALGFVHISSSNINLEVTPRHLNKRASFAVPALQILTGCPFDEAVDDKEFDNELELLQTGIIEKERCLQKSSTNSRFLICS